MNAHHCDNIIMLHRSIGNTSIGHLASKECQGCDMATQRMPSIGNCQDDRTREKGTEVSLKQNNGNETSFIISQTTLPHSQHGLTFDSDVQSQSGLQGHEAPRIWVHSFVVALSTFVIALAQPLLSVIIN